MSVKVNQGQANEAFASKPFFLGTSNSSNDDPPDSGADWIDIATVDVVNGVITIL